MVDPSILSGAGAPRPVSGPAAGQVGAPATPKPQGAAFQALLEKLETQARDLARASEQVEGPAELAGAVDSARSSLEDALSLSDRLLEAYRANRHAAESSPSHPDTRGKN